MPKPLEEALKRRAAQHGFERGTPEYKAYVDGTKALILEHARKQEDASGKQPE